MLKDTLNPILYDASALNYNWSVSSIDEGIKFKFYGFSNKLVNISSVVVSALENQQSMFTEQYFIQSVEKKRMYWTNNKYATLYNNIPRFMNELVDPMYPTIDTLVKTLNELKYEDLFKLFDNKNMKLTALIEGNLNNEQAIDIVNPFNKYINKVNLNGKFVEDKYKSYIDVTKSVIKYDIAPNEKETSFCAMVSYLYNYESKVSDPDYYSNTAYQNIISTILKAPYFNQIRTNEQLGYAVFAYYNSFGRNCHQLSNQTFIIQSPSVESEKLVARINLYVKEFYEELLKLTDEELEKNKLSYISKLLKEPLNLHDEYSNDANSLSANELSFEYNKLEANEVSKITKNDLVAYYKKYFIDSPVIFSLGLDPSKLKE